MTKNNFKVLIIDDEVDLAEQVCDHLDLEGFETQALNDSEKAISCTTKFKPDVIILDKLMPGSDGIDVLKKIRKTDSISNIPVIMLTACNTKFDKVWAFKAGVDDYLAKPFDIDELVMRLRALNKRSQKETTSSNSSQNATLKRNISQDSFGIEVSGQYITLGDKEVSLTSFEFDFLKELIRRNGSTFSNIEIQEILTQSNSSLDKIKADIHNLKDKLEYVGSKIKEVRGVGYRLAS